MNKLLDVSRTDGYPMCAETVEALNSQSEFLEAVMNGFLLQNNDAMILSGQNPDEFYIGIKPGKIVKTRTNIRPDDADYPTLSKLINNPGKYNLIDRSQTVNINKQGSTTEVYENCFLQEIYEISVVNVGGYLFKQFSYLNDLINTKVPFAVPGVSFPYMSVSNNIYVDINPTDMYLNVDGLQNVNIRGRMYFKSGWLAVPKSWLILFNTDSNTVFATYKSKIKPAYPFSSNSSDVYFTGYNQSDPTEIFHFRIRKNGDFEVFIDTTAFEGKYVFINVMYSNLLSSNS